MIKTFFSLEKLTDQCQRQTRDKVEGDRCYNKGKETC